MHSSLFLYIYYCTSFVPCSHCNFCLDGRYNLCSHIIHRGTFPFDGLFTKYVTHPTAWLHSYFIGKYLSIILKLHICCFYLSSPPIPWIACEKQLFQLNQRRRKKKQSQKIMIITKYVANNKLTLQ